MSEKNRSKAERIDASMEKVEAMLKQPQTNIGAERIVFTTIHFLGGPDRFAEMLAREIEDAAPGSVARQRLFDLIGRILVCVDAQRKKSTVDLNQLSDEDLLAESKRLLEEMIPDD